MGIVGDAGDDRLADQKVQSDIAILLIFMQFVVVLLSSIPSISSISTSPFVGWLAPTHC